MKKKLLVYRVVPLAALSLLALAGLLALDLPAVDAETASVTLKFPKGESR